MRSDIVAAATSVLDAEGVGALSMRRVAAVLGTGPSTLYWHVRDKEQLLGLILDETLAAVPLPTEGDWRARLVALMVAARQALLPRPVLVPVILGARWDVGRHGLRIADAVLGLLAEGGVLESAIADAYFVLLHYLVGTVEAEAAARWNATFARRARRHGRVARRRLSARRLSQPRPLRSRHRACRHGPSVPGRIDHDPRRAAYCRLTAPTRADPSFRPRPARRSPCSFQAGLGGNPNWQSNRYDRGEPYELPGPEKSAWTRWTN